VAAELSARELLRARPAFRRLCIALSLSATGTGIAATALVLYVQSTLGTGIAVAALLVAETLPRLLGPLAGSLVDRLELRRLLIGCDTGQAVIYAILALLPPFGAILALAAGSTLLQAGYSPARGTSLPPLVGEENLLTANALTNTALNLQIAIGPVIGGFLVALGGTSLALGVNAATFLVSALISSTLPSLPAQADRDESQGVFSSARAALRYARNDPVVRTVLWTLFAVVALLGVDNVALVFLVRDTLGGGPAAFGVVSAAFGIGMLSGSLGLMRGRSAANTGAIYSFGILLTGAGTLLTGFAPLLVLAFAAQLVAGFGNGFENIAHDTLMQQLAPRHMLGRLFGLMATAAFAGAGLSAAIGGILVDVTSPRTVFIGAGLGGLAVAAIAMPRLRAAGAGPEE